MIERLAVTDSHVEVSLSGTISVGEATAMRERLLPYAEAGRHFRINLAQVQQIDSSGLGALAALQRKTREQGGTLLLLGVQGELQELFEQKQLHQMFDYQEEEV